MENLLIWTIVIGKGIILGIIPALIAKSKERSFLLWWLYGFILLFIALPHAIIMSKKIKLSEKINLENNKKCPYCAELIKKEAILCRFCKNKIQLDTNNQNTIKEPIKNQFEISSSTIQKSLKFIGVMLLVLAADYLITSLMSPYIKTINRNKVALDEYNKKQENKYNFDGTYTIDLSLSTCGRLGYEFKKNYSDSFQGVENPGMIYKSNCKLVDGKYQGYIFPSNKIYYRVFWSETDDGSVKYMNANF